MTRHASFKRRSTYSAGRETALSAGCEHDGAQSGGYCETHRAYGIRRTQNNVKLVLFAFLLLSLLLPSEVNAIAQQHLLFQLSICREEEWGNDAHRARPRDMLEKVCAGRVVFRSLAGPRQAGLTFGSKARLDWTDRRLRLELMLDWFRI